MNTEKADLPFEFYTKTFSTLVHKLTRSLVSESKDHLELEESIEYFDCPCASTTDSLILWTETTMLVDIRQYNKYYEEVRRIASLQTGARQSALEMARKAKPRLLVCAPSNAAVDNIILKLCKTALWMDKGSITILA